MSAKCNICWNIVQNQDKHLRILEFLELFNHSFLKLIMCLICFLLWIYRLKIHSIQIVKWKVKILKRHDEAEPEKNWEMLYPIFICSSGYLKSEFPGILISSDGFLPSCNAKGWTSRRFQTLFTNFCIRKYSKKCSSISLASGWTFCVMCDGFVHSAHEFRSFQRQWFSCD